MNAYSIRPWRKLLLAAPLLAALAWGLAPPRVGSAEVFSEAAPAPSVEVDAGAGTATLSFKDANGALVTNSNPFAPGDTSACTRTIGP